MRAARARKATATRVAGGILVAKGSLRVHGRAWAEDRAYDVLAVGELNIDLILSGLPRLPAFGTEVLADSLARRLGGSTANFAVFCAQLGLRVAFLTRVGADDFGDFLLRQLEQAGVATTHVTRDRELHTGLAVAISGPTDRAFITYVGTINSLRAQDMPGDLLARCRHLHVGSYFLQERLQPGCRDLFRRAHRAGMTVSLDTGYDPREAWDDGIRAVLREVDVFMPNRVEATHIAGTHDQAEALRVLTGWSRLVAMKLGPEGAIACEGRQCVHVPTCGVEVADTTCCGDAFDAGLIDGLLAGRSLADCVRRGNACGALMASVMGNEARVLTPEAVAARMRECGSPVPTRI